MMKMHRFIVLAALSPIVAIAAIVGTLYVKDIKNGNGYENTESTEDAQIRQIAATKIIVQQANVTGRKPGNQFKIVYKDGGSEICTGAGSLSEACQLQPGTLQMPSQVIGAGGGDPYYEPATCSVASLTPYGHYDVTVVKQGGDSYVTQYDFVIDGYTADSNC